MTISKEKLMLINSDYTIAEVFKVLGKNDGIAGSGILYYVWDIDDGTKAKILFSRSEQKVCRILIADVGKKDKVIYKRTQDI